jgi:hypothetical protein
MVAQATIFILIGVVADCHVRVEFRNIGNGPLILIHIKKVD